MAARRGNRYRLPKNGRARSRGTGARVLFALFLLVAIGVSVVWLFRDLGKTPRRSPPESFVVPETPAPTTHSTGVPEPAPDVRVSTNLLRREARARETASTETPRADQPPALAWGPDPSWRPRPVTNLLEAQIALATHGISGGSIDGVGGAQSAAALRAFQMKMGLEQTGRLDRETLRELQLDRPPFAVFVVAPGHLARLVHIPPTWLAKSRLESLDYESLLEFVAESAHASPVLVRRINPGVDWNAVNPGATLSVPDVRFAPARRAARIRVSLAGRHLRAFDEHGGLLAHFPCSIGRIAEKRPVGSLHVAVVAKDPNYTFDPAVFPESDEGRVLGRRLVIPPGPNNPVGVAWIGLDRPGYGIHGTPAPEQVGKTESHGCFRLANWNAEYLRQMAWVGLPVSVEP